MVFQNKSNVTGGGPTSSSETASIEVAQALLSQTIPIVWESVVNKMNEPNFQAEVAKVIRSNPGIQKTARETGLSDMQLQWLAVQTVAALTQSIATGTGIQVEKTKKSPFRAQSKPQVNKINQPQQPSVEVVNMQKKPAVTKLKTKVKAAMQQQGNSFKPQTQQGAGGFFDKISDFSFEDLADTLKAGSEQIRYNAEKYELKEKSEQLAHAVGGVLSNLKRKINLAYEAIKEDSEANKNQKGS